VQQSSHSSKRGVAVIGMAGRFPGALSLDQFWANLQGGVESISFFSQEELRSAGIDVSLINNRTYVAARGVVEDIECFDNLLFDVSPMEASLTDPQHRVLLECSWEALELAGYPAGAIEERVAVYAGSGTSD